MLSRTACFILYFLILSIFRLLLLNRQSNELFSNSNTTAYGISVKDLCLFIQINLYREVIVDPFPLLGKIS